MHVGFRDIFDHHGNIIIPCAYGLVVRGSNKPSVFIHEGDGINRAQVLVVLLCDFTGVHVILQGGVNSAAAPVCKSKTWTCLDDLLVGHARQKYVLLVFIRVESDDVWDFAIAKTFQALASLGVP